MNKFSKFELKDCMVGMAKYPDKYFDLAVVDPPYFDGPQSKIYYGKPTSSTGIRRNQNSNNHWEKVDIAYFKELNRVSKKYIFWGCNYYSFDFHSGRIVWDKVNDGSDFSDCEIAATNLFDHVKQIRYMWNGMMQGSSILNGHIQQGNKKKNEKRIHPTQKPIALYAWILQSFADAGGLIIDTHVGSASSLIACEELGFDYVGFEIDPDCFKSATERIERFRSQLNLFRQDKQTMPVVQSNIFRQIDD